MVSYPNTYLPDSRSQYGYLLTQVLGHPEHTHTHTQKKRTCTFGLKLLFMWSSTNGVCKLFRFCYPPSCRIIFWLLPASFLSCEQKIQKGNYSEFEIGKLMVMMLLQTTSKKKRTRLLKMISRWTPVKNLKLMIFFWVCWQVTESDLTKPSPAKKTK
jgi:hypothetical protein